MDLFTIYHLLRYLRAPNELIDGARQCVAAAYHDTNVQFHNRFLHADAYGTRHAPVVDQGITKPHRSDYNRSEYKIAQSGGSAAWKEKYERVRRDNPSTPTSLAILRELNDARASSAGILVTKPQLSTPVVGAIVDRLSRYGEHTRALRPATLIGVTVYDVCTEWESATMKNASSMSKNTLATLMPQPCATSTIMTVAKKAETSESKDLNSELDKAHRTISRIHSMIIQTKTVSATDVAKVTQRSNMVENLEHKSESERKKALEAVKKPTVLPNGELDLEATGKTDEGEEH